MPDEDPRQTVARSNTAPHQGNGKRLRVNPSDLRERIPELGLKEYWYPAIPLNKVPRHKPTRVKLLGETLAFFWGEKTVTATASVCPHRGADITAGKCHFKGTVTCPYHGWTFNEDGQCVAVLGEGPDSYIAGQPSAAIRVYPTRVVKGLVFVWMGDNDPVALEEDVPEHLFDPEVLLQYRSRVWQCNWRPAVENLLDAHVFYLHRNSLQVLLSSPSGLMALSNMGPRRPKPKNVNDRALTYDPKDIPFLAAIANTGTDQQEEEATATQERSPKAVLRRPQRALERRLGRLPERSSSFRSQYPGIGGAKWPKTNTRLRFSQIVAPFLRKPPAEPFVKDEEWRHFHLPSTFQVDYHGALYSRVTVPIDEGSSRVFYLYGTRPRTKVQRIRDRAAFKAYLDWKLNANFSNQDKRLVERQEYGAPEKLSATDVFPIEIRRMIVAHARDFNGDAEDDAHRP